MTGAPGAGGPEGRVGAAEALLAREGIEARVRPVGMDGEIAAVEAASQHASALTRLAPEIRALGFRYVALDLGPGDHEGE